MTQLLWTLTASLCSVSVLFLHFFLFEVDEAGHLAVKLAFPHILRISYYAEYIIMTYIICDSFATIILNAITT